MIFAGSAEQIWFSQCYFSGSRGGFANRSGKIRTFIILQSTVMPAQASCTIAEVLADVVHRSMQWLIQH